MKQQQKISLLITSGGGPEECRMAVSRILKVMETEAASSAVHCEFVSSNEKNRRWPSSVVATLSGKHALDISRRWSGTVQWICRSQVRPKHKRRNWFVGVFEIQTTTEDGENLNSSDLRFETFRAGGPGGQHQNTTDSAVRVTHLPSGLSATSRDQRSQHRNKQVATDRLSDRLQAQHALQQSLADHAQNKLHKSLERGNPVRIFVGENFTEKT